jgi:ATP-dependent protease Clp ATPase subunit
MNLFRNFRTLSLSSNKGSRPEKLELAVNVLFVGTNLSGKTTLLQTHVKQKDLVSTVCKTTSVLTFFNEC